MAVYSQIDLAKNLIAIAGNADRESFPFDRSSISDPHQLQTLAAELLANAVKEAKSLDNLRAESYALGTLGYLYEQTGQFTIAEQLTEQALALAQAINAPDIAYQWQWQLGRLLIGQNYQWSIAMICDRNDRLGDQVVNAWIKRIEPSQELSRQLEVANIADRAAFYAQHGIWYETVSTLAQLWVQSEDSIAIASAWKQLLTSETVQLEQISEIPLIPPQVGES